MTTEASTHTNVHSNGNGNAAVLEQQQHAMTENNVDPMTEFANAFRRAQAAFKPLQTAYQRMERQNQTLNKKKVAKKEKKGGGGMPAAFQKPTRMSDALCAFIGKPPNSVLPRHQIIQEVRASLNEKNLRTPGNGGKYFLVPEMKALFPADAPEAAPDATEVGFFRLQKLLKDHLETVQSDAETGGEERGTDAAGKDQ